MATISVKYPDGSEAQIDAHGDGSGRVLIGSGEQCQIRLPVDGILPVHAYLAGRSNHYGLLLAPGAKVVCNGREVVNEEQPASELDLARFQWVMRDRFTVELAGAVVTVRHACG